MNDEILLSICIPTYNRGKILCETLDSIISQFDGNLEKNIEIIISNNDSPDNTDKIITPYLEKYKNIRYFKNETNLGSAINVIKVTDYAVGKYLWLLTDDDCATKFSISYILKIISETDFDLMLGKFTIWEGKKVSDFNETFLGYDKFNSFREFTDFIGEQEGKNLKELSSFFSYYSIFFIKKDYLNKMKNNIKLNNINISNHSFPHSFLAYYGIKDKTIILSRNIFTLAMGHPASWKPNYKIIKDIKDIFNLFLNSDINIKFYKKAKKYLFIFSNIIYMNIILDFLRLKKTVKYIIIKLLKYTENNFIGKFIKKFI